MPKKKSILLFLIINIFNFSAAQTETPLQQAKDLYAQGKYAQTVEIYENLLKTSEVAPELYYNLGNAYFKQNQIARAILNYERALRLAPNYADARHNLVFVQQKVVDNIPDYGSFFLVRWLENIVNLCNSNVWLYVSFALFLSSLIFAFVFIFGGKYRLRKTSFYIALLCFIISILTLFFANIQKNKILNRNAAIIMDAAVTVKSSPDKSGTDLFLLHEGTKIVVVDRLNYWVEIKLANGNTGWIEQHTIEII
ncbi:MAG: tetratricopeptide repeat protein [Prevotellaceae bacterium]|jgi:tetratricopeptide (TPR) repeat protein|nr:tetratricopeptide repeat protein [Prevotellaceae bacterium]